MRIKNAAVSAASRVPLVSLARASQAGSKKVAQLPPFPTTLMAPDPKDAASTILELDELWSFVLKKTNDFWMRDCAVSQDAAGGRLCRWESEPKDVSAVEGGHSARISPGPLLHRLFERLCLRDTRGVTHRCGQRTAHVERWNNTLRQRLARFVRITLSLVHDHARGLFASLFFTATY